MIPDPERKNSWADYQKWPSDKRWEIIDGRAYAMTAPTTIHQSICGELYVALHGHFKGRSCQVFISPVDVKLSEHDVVQPDLLVACHPDRVLRTHVEGPPDLVVEVLSPSTYRHDRVRKMRLYARAGVKEYWLLDSEGAIAEVLLLDGENYTFAGVFGYEDQLWSPTFPELRINLTDIFPEDPVDGVHESEGPYQFSSN